MTHPETTTPANPAQGGSKKLPATRAYVDRLIRIFRDRPADDTSAVVLIDYARDALTATTVGAGRSSEPEFAIAPDNGTPKEILAYVLDCARRWVPEARIIGNARAGDIERAIAAIGAGGQAVAVKPLEWMPLDNGTAWSKWNNTELVYHARRRAAHRRRHPRSCNEGKRGLSAQVETECRCGSCQARRAAALPGYKCGCCNGTGSVLSALGSLRPCSRCQNAAFSEWSRATPEGERE